MAESEIKSESEGVKGEKETETEAMEEKSAQAAVMGRKQKRKEKKKMKRKEVRKEIAIKEREEEEAKINDPEEQTRVEKIEEEERVKMERDRKEFEERERKFLEELELKKKLLEQQIEEENNQVENGNKCDDVDEDGDFEYVEEGPAEIIWQGNEIIVRKKKVKVPKKKSDVDGQSRIDVDDDRPTSNPLPPQSVVFAEFQNASMPSAEQLLESVAQQVPNFGTEQDKAHCPFHLKTGACRFGMRCSRVHFYPDKANTLLMKNMYNGPGLACEQDEGLEYTDEEVERSYEEFYEDVHTEYLKYGEIVNFKVCKNSSFHLRGNVYVHYKSLDSAVLAYQSINGRYFGGKQISCEFVNVTRWKVAICGEFMKSRLKMCSRGTTCNFIHCFRNPGGDYEWADWDKPPPRYWIRKMTALFGYSDDSAYKKQMEQEKYDHRVLSSNTKLTDEDSHRQSSSRSRDINHTVSHSGKSSKDEDDDQESLRRCWHTDDDRKRIWVHDEKHKREYHHSEHRSQDSDFDRGWSGSDNEVNRERNKYRGHVRKRSKYHAEVTKDSLHRPRGKSRDENHASDSDAWSDRDRNEHKKHARNEDSRHGLERVILDNNRDRKNEFSGEDKYQSDTEKHQSHREGSSRHQSKVMLADHISSDKASYRDRDRQKHDRSKRRSSRHRSSSSSDLPDDKASYRDRDKHNHDHSKRRSSRHRSSSSDLPDDKASYRDRNEHNHDHSKRRSSRYRSSSSELPDDYQGDRYRTHDDDSFEKNSERHGNHKRRRLRGSEEDLLDDERNTVKRSKEKSCREDAKMGKDHLKRKPTDNNRSRKSYSSRQSTETHSRHGSLSPRKSNDHNCSNRGTRHKSITESNEQDRWKPESPDM